MISSNSQTDGCRCVSLGTDTDGGGVWRRTARWFVTPSQSSPDNAPSPGKKRKKPPRPRLYGPVRLPGIFNPTTGAPCQANRGVFKVSSQGGEQKGRRMGNMTVEHQHGQKAPCPPNTSPTKDLDATPPTRALPLLPQPPPPLPSLLRESGDWGSYRGGWAGGGWGKTP